VNVIIFLVRVEGQNRETSASYDSCLPHSSVTLCVAGCGLHRKHCARNDLAAEHHFSHAKIAYLGLTTLICKGNSYGYAAD